MTTITLPRAVVEHALEAMDREIDTRRCKASTLRAMIALRAALAQQAEPVQEPITRLFGTLPVHDAQQAEPVEPVALKHRHEWFRTGDMEPGQFRCIHCGVWEQEQSDPQVADRLARHGIPMLGDPK